MGEGIIRKFRIYAKFDGKCKESEPIGSNSLFDTFFPDCVWGCSSHAVSVHGRILFRLLL
jgi:hypothetical protein